MNPRTPPDTPYYELRVADNFSYMDKEAEYSAGFFVSAEEVLAKCRIIVEQCLKECAEPGSTAEEIYGCYTYYGDDPYVIPRNGAPDVTFSAWEYAKERSEDYANPKQSELPF